MSKMGISTVASYRSSKLFEAVGINYTPTDTNDESAFVIVKLRDTGFITTLKS